MADKIARLVAGLPGVRGAVREAAAQKAAQAEAKLAAHHRAGAHHIGVEHLILNSIVYMEGPSSGAVEFGHFASDGETWVEGIVALTGEG